TIHDDARLSAEGDADDDPVAWLEQRIAEQGEIGREVRGALDLKAHLETRALALRDLNALQSLHQQFRGRKRHDLAYQQLKLDAGYAHDGSWNCGGETRRTWPT